MSTTGAGGLRGAPTAMGFGTEEHPLVHPITGERIVFRRRAADTGGQTLEFSLFLAPRGFIATPHVHPNQEERFEIGGTAPVTFKVAGKERVYQPGDVVVVPPGTAHTWWNPGTEEVATLIQFRPALDTETFFETFFGLARDGNVGKNGLPNPLQMSVLARDYRREMALPAPAKWVLGPMSILLAPAARALGYRGRYDKYSGPRRSNERAGG